MKLDYVGSRTRTPGKILEKLYVHSRGNSFDSMFTKLFQNVSSMNLRPCLKLDHVGQKLDLQVKP